MGAGAALCSEAGSVTQPCPMHSHSSPPTSAPAPPPHHLDDCQPLLSRCILRVVCRQCLVQQRCQPRLASQVVGQRRRRGGDQRCPLLPHGGLLGGLPLLLSLEIRRGGMETGAKG